MGIAQSVRVLPLDGEDGGVACRIHTPLLNSTVPAYSESGRIECATRSWLRMRRLVAVRGTQTGTRMIGPTDYYGNLERPHLFSFSFDITDSVATKPPVVYRSPREAALATSFRPCKPLTPRDCVRVNAVWQSAGERTSTSKQESFVLGGSLFSQRGVFWFQQPSVILPAFDARGTDLKPFRSAIVRNDEPFVLCDVPLPSSDEFRLIRYIYEPGYAKEQTRPDTGGGLFLEHHPFAQSITPLSSSACDGFVTLAKPTNERHEWDMIAVHIPFGYTLIIYPFAIHGDATLRGPFMMAMTSNHETMEKANTVFIKHSDGTGTVRNVRLHRGIPVSISISTADTKEVSFVPETLGLSEPATPATVIFHPTSAAYWHHDRCLTPVTSVSASAECALKK